ncbi:MAG: VRR-NUC domain-containing protein [Bdellovibrionaceae bacterium]|nr:VRR-NUC domain-containing protein [Pseudobdellovibrionaceae bacterium]
MSNIVLPDKYYLSHFFELIQHLERHYSLVLEDSHRKFLTSFYGLSETAQCAYVRMINRKGRVFAANSFAKYIEIPDYLAALGELEANHFVSRLSENDKPMLIEFLTKTELAKWLKKSGVRVSSSEPRGDLILKAYENASQLVLETLESFSELLVQRNFDELDYLLFLYFGRIQRNLTLYTLRDLGIRQAYSLKTEFSSRYAELQDAKNDYFFHSEIERLSEDQNEVEIWSKLAFSRGIKYSPVKDQWLLGLAIKFENVNREVTITALKQCLSHPARERLVRLFYKWEQPETARSVLEDIIQDPYCDEELLFAEDFFARKFGKKKTGSLTDILNNSKQVTLSDVYLKKPEQGVIDLLSKQGYRAQFTENYLWLGLFGLIFWDELFDSSSSMLFNPFDRKPADLSGPEFYGRNEVVIESKLAQVNNPAAMEFSILKTVTQHYGKMNDLFQWNTGLATLVLDFIKKSKTKNVAHILRTMAKRFDVYHSGYPDLIVEKNDEISFVEVKAEGDSLRYKQLSKARLLQEAGFEVEVLRVKWQSDPNQVYVVIDVETTGGAPQSHRVTEIGAVKVQGGKVVDEFQTLINPERSIPPFISKLTGITDEMVQTAPKFAEIADKFMEFMDGAIFVAHNVKFDFSFIQKEFERAEKSFHRTQICTCLGMKKNFPGLKSYGLKNLTQYFQISLDQHHRALCDAKAAAELLFLMTGYKEPNPKPVLEPMLEHVDELKETV